MINHRLAGRKFRIRQILIIKKRRFDRVQDAYFQEKDLFDNLV
jgi:hypothetical protein